MEYRVLKYFLTVARVENITRASELLHISQPALSRQLMQLEEELGAQLFVRGKRNITLTDAGRLLYRRALDIIYLTEKTEREFRDGDKLTGVVSIGNEEAETMHFIADCMREFNEKYPNVTFDLYANSADHIKERLERELLDIGILILPADISRYEYIRLPQSERWGALLSAHSPLANKEYIEPQDLIGQKIIISRRGVAQGVEQWFGEYFGQINIIATFNLLYNAVMLVDSGIGAALAVEGAVSLYRNPDIVFRPFYPTLTVNSAIVWKKTQPVTPAAVQFIELMKQKANALNLSS